MRSLIYLLFLFFTCLEFISQNNVHIFSGTGELFMVSTGNAKTGNLPQANVLLQHILEDTLHIKIVFENKTTFETTLFLYEKGKPVKNKEFNYRLIREQNKTKINYSGYYEIVKLPEPLVPLKPLIDTNAKYKNTRLGHFCELVNSKPVYYNNIPKKDVCTKAMPEDYLNFTNLLMVKAQVPDDKFIIAENVCLNNCLSIEQLNFILKYIDFEIEKLKIIKTAYFNVTDKENKKNLEKAFRYESSINELNSFFTTAVDPKSFASNSCKTASSNEEIKNLADILSVYTNDSQRYEAFKKSYNSYCYTKSQAISILTIFIHDREKLDAAKMLYFRSTEKDSFLQVSEVFSYNETISQLKDFLDKQKD